MTSLQTLTPDQKLLREFDDKFKACATARQSIEKQWYTNLAFYFGKQYVEWTKSVTGLGSSLVQPKAPSWRVRLVSNKIKPIIRKELTKLSKEEPQFWVVPNSPDDLEIMAARAAEYVAEAIIYETSFNRKRRHAAWWATVLGNGFTKTYFNEANQDISIDVVSPFHLWVPDLENPEVEEQPYIFIGKGLDPDDVEAMFGIKLEPDVSTNAPENKFLHSMGIEAKAKELRHVFVKEVWVKPNTKFPDGAMFIYNGSNLLYMQEHIQQPELDEVTGKKLFDESGNVLFKTPTPSNIVGGGQPVSSFPYEHGKYPITKIDHIPTGKFYCESVIVDLIPLQKEYNRSRSQSIEARNLTAKPQWTVVKGSVDVTKLNAQPGSIIEYTPGFARPEPVNNPELPAYVNVIDERTLNDIDYISNQYEVTQGRTPPGVEAASAIAYLQEETDTILYHTVASLEEAVADIGFKALYLAKRYWPEDKIVKIVSGNELQEAMAFKSSMLSDNIDFRVESGSMAPRSRAAKQAFIMELIKTGIVPPLEAMKYLQSTETNKLYADLQIDMRQAQRENFKFKQGIEVPINEFDNHTSHILTHERFLKSQEYEMADDQIKQLALTHYRLHMQALGAQVQDEMQADSEQGQVDGPTNPS